MDPTMQGGGMGGMIQQVLQQLMQDPTAMQGMMNFMQGQSPTAGMPTPPSQSGGMPPGMSGMTAPPPPPGMNMPPGMGAPPAGSPMPPDMEGGDTEAPEEDPEAMAQSQIDNAGYTWDGVDAPTKNDIQRLKEDASDEAKASFDEQFGEGAAERYLGNGEQQDSGDSDQEPEPDEDDTKDERDY